MDLKKIIPPWHAVLREGLIVAGGVLIGAWIISRFPKAQEFVTGNSVTLKDGNGNTII